MVSSPLSGELCCQSLDYKTNFWEIELNCQRLARCVSDTKLLLGGVSMKLELSANFCYKHNSNYLQNDFGEN